MKDRLRDVSKILAALAGGEVARAVGFRAPGGAGSEAVDRQQHRARAIRHSLEQLGPFYIKMGQMLSTRPDIVPDYMIEEFQHLHSQVSVAPFASFEEVLEEELGRDWNKHFKEIVTDRPLGAASLAQVYRVTLQNGTPAVVKIQRPGVIPMMLDDMALLRRAARILAKRAPNFNEVVDVEAMLETIFRAMEPELDFRVEGRNTTEASEFIGRYEHLAVPEVIFATRKVLVQSLAPGCSIRDADRDAFSAEEREAIGRELLGFMFRGFFVDRIFHADPHPGNIFVEPGQPAHLIDWGMVGRMDRRLSTSLVMTLLNIAQNDGVAVARSWVEMGRATSCANLSAFEADMAGLIPTLAGASMEEMNLGVSLTSILKYSTRRGIQTPTVVALLGKSFANLDGSIRYLAPELNMLEVFEEEFQDILFDLVKEALSPETGVKLALQSLISSLALPEQASIVTRDIASRDFTINVNEFPGRRSEDRADARMKMLTRTALAVVGAAWWRERRRHR
ncbi:MAG TPA: AarF/UbiB family protein [Acidimicrobiia bacterium]|nr:AarF/UbiB family protein [Acidimicrobiia bacterium]